VFFRYFKASVLSILQVLSSYHTIPGLSQESQQRANAIYSLLLAKADELIPFLESNDKLVCLETIWLIGRFYDSKPEFVFNLLDRFEGSYDTSEYDTSEAEYISFMHVMQRWLKPNTEHFEDVSSRFELILRKLLTNTFTGLSVHAHAALYLIDLLGKHTDRIFIQQLANVLKLSTHYGLYSVPSLQECADVMSKMGIPETTEFFLNVFDDQTNPSLLIDILCILLSLNFGTADYHKIRVHEVSTTGSYTVDSETEIAYTIEFPLSDLQKFVLTHLVSKEHLWTQDFSSLLKLFSLPQTRQAIQQLLADSDGFDSHIS